LLHIIWTHENHLSGFEEQDAQEFLMGLFNIIHSQNCGELTKDGKCSCIVDKIFNGSLQSDVICSQCGNVSTTTDPVCDISLQLESSNCPTDSHSFTLENCLWRFTHSETLSNFYCDNCKLALSATKKLTISQAPTIACFHLKRFQYLKKSRSRSRKKIKSHVSFPEYFDLTPYLSSQLIENNNNNVDLNNNTYFFYLLWLVILVCQLKQVITFVI